MKLVIAPIIAKTEEYSKANEENADSGHITWDNMKEMVDSGVCGNSKPYVSVTYK